MNVKAMMCGFLIAAMVIHVAFLVSSLSRSAKSPHGKTAMFAQIYECTWILVCGALAGQAFHEWATD